MTTGNALVSIAAIAMSLVLALRALRSRGLSFERKAWMMVAWALIIAVLAFVLARLRG